MTDNPKSSSPPDNDHAWVHDHLATALAGGLLADEQSRFDAHINACPECFDAFTEARDADRALQRALAPLASSASFEQTLLHTLREKTMHKRFTPLLKRAGFAIAASVALAASGVFAQYVITHDNITRPLADRQLADARSHGFSLPSFLKFHLGADTPPSADHPYTAANLHGLIQSQVVYSHENADAYPLVSTGERKTWNSAGHGRNGQEVGFADSHTEWGVSSPGSGKDGGFRNGKETLDLNLVTANGGTTDANGNHATAADVPTKNGVGEWRLGDGSTTYTGSLTLDGGTLDSSRTLAMTGGNKFSRTSGDTLDLPQKHLEGQSQQGRQGQQPGKFTGQTEKTAIAAGESHDQPQQNFYSNFNGAVQDRVENQPIASGHGGFGVGGAGGGGSGGATSFRPGDFSKHETTIGHTEVATVTDLKTVDATTKGTSAPFDIVQVPVADVGTGERDGGPAPGLFTAAGDIAAATRPASPVSAAPQSPTANTTAPEIAQRKIIRNGTMEFEVVSFDGASSTISSIVTEEGGYVSSTSSDKLANGKIRGTIVVRVPPDHLDRMILKLRALGDLKTQQIAANDVTKEYTDVESELRGLRTMETRMIDLIKNGKGEVKDLVAAEKQLGEYRVRIEKLEGDIRYYNNLVGMATLTIIAYEKDIQKPTAAFEQENVNLSLETEDVETKYLAARKILTDAKGRIVESELKKSDAGQYSARITVDVPPDQTDFVTAQLKQIGTVADYNRDRHQTTTGGTGVPTVQVEQKDTRFTITLYNLANVAPRETAVLTIAVPDVEAAYQKALALVRQPVTITPPPQPAAPELRTQNSELRTSVGRVITSNITGQQPDQMTADIRADVRSDEADKILQTIRASGEILSSTLTQNPDTANTTLAKRGIQLRLANVASVRPRETQTMQGVAANVSDAYTKLLAALGAAGGPANPSVRIIKSELRETDPRTVTASLAFEARRDALTAVDNALKAAGIDFLSRNVVRSADTANTLDSKVLFQVDSLIAADALAPRRTTVLGIELDGVEKALDSLRATLPPDAREIEYNVAKEPNGRVTGHLVVETPLASAMTVLTRIKDLGGTEKVNQVVKNANVPDAAFARERFDLTLTSPQALVESGKGFTSTIRAALGSAATALLLSLYLILTGILFAGPFLLIVWIAYRLFRRRPGTATA